MIAGFDPFSITVDQYTTPLVFEEIRADSMISLRFGTALESGKVKIIQPSAEALTEARTAAASVGDAHLLSETDMQLLALALQLKQAECEPQIVTDDYSIQNVASKRGLQFVSLATFGIRRILKWIRYCPACHRVYPAEYKGKTCAICGTQLKRKPERPRVKH